MRKSPTSREVFGITSLVCTHASEGVGCVVWHSWVSGTGREADGQRTVCQGEAAQRAPVQPQVVHRSIHNRVTGPDRPLYKPLNRDPDRLIQTTSSNGYVYVLEEES